MKTIIEFFEAYAEKYSNHPMPHEYGKNAIQS